MLFRRWLLNWCRWNGKRDFVLKCFYVFFLIMCIYETFMVIFEYFRQPVSTSITFVRENKQEPLPYIEVCSQYWVDKRRLKRWKISARLFEYIKSGFLGFNNYKSLRPSAELSKLNRQFRKLIRKHPDFDYRSFFKSVALPREALMPYCRWQEKNYSCDALFEAIFSPSGLCYLLRSENAPQQTVPGPGGGLRFIITRRVDREPEVFYNTGFDDGIHLSISGQWQPQITDPLFISMGKRAYLQIKRTKFKRVSDCTVSGRLTLFHERYSQPACLHECQVKHALRKCNCTSFTDNVALPAHQFCSPRAFRRCIRPLFDTSVKRNAQPAKREVFYTNYQGECLKECPRACDSEEISTTVSYAHTDPWRVALYNKRKERKWNEKGTIMVHVYYSQIGHTLIEEQWTTTFATVLSNIGGQLGLWVGFSAMSTTMFLLKRYNRLAQTRKKRRQQRLEVAVETDHALTPNAPVETCFYVDELEQST